MLGPPAFTSDREMIRLILACASQAGPWDVQITEASCRSMTEPTSPERPGPKSTSFGVTGGVGLRKGT